MKLVYNEIEDSRSIEYNLWLYSNTQNHAFEKNKYKNMENSILKYI